VGFLEGVFYFQFKKNKLANNYISNSLSDTLIISSLNTYLDCRFEKIAIPFINESFKFSGKLPIDENHKFPGIGKINVLAWTDANELNLKNSKIHFEYKSSLPNSRLHFWFQVKRKNKRIANFMSTLPIFEFSTFRNGYYLVNIPIGQVDFKCMGTSFLKRRVYGCDISLEEALMNVNVNFGLVNLLSDSYKDNCTHVNLVIRNIYLIK
jgi:hypothetical protein